MANLVEVTYNQTGNSKKTNAFGMREMQEKAFKANSAQYLLIKAPPASGKSRALMFIALEKLHHQGIKKVIVAVPEKTIGASFGTTELKKHGFFADWAPNPKYNLCTPGSEKSKVKAFLEFLETDEQILICTHATLRFAFEGLDEKKLNDTVVAIDEFHHVSADGDNKLGEVMKNIMAKSNAHIVAMTGSYFRGDSVPVLMPEDEAKFTKVTYNYYEQLNGYEYLKSLGIGYHFYWGKYFKKQPDREMSALEEILDESKKTIIHIPSVNSAESSREKLEEVGHIMDVLGDLEYQDEKTGVLHVKSKRTGKMLKVADLVNDNPKSRDKISAYLRKIKSADDMDIIIALGMAKEGFDWPYCEHALTIGYRGSLTEIIQIIGRATRDSNNKTHAQFTNLVAEPDAENEEVKVAVNNMLKAITASLLMEQVLAPNFRFKLKETGDEEEFNEEEEENTIRIRGFKLPTSQRAKDIIESDLNDLKARILQDGRMLKAMPGNIEPEVINTVLIPKIIREVYPYLSDEDVEAVRQHVVVDSVIKNSIIEEQGNKKFIRMAGSFVNIDDIHIDLIDQINPFQKAFEILSKSVTKQVLKLIDEHIQSTKIEMTEEEAIIYWPKIKEYRERTGEAPSLQSFDPKEKRMAEAIVFLRELKRQKMLHE
ncbi:MAG: ATP-dependent helicase [Bacteroidetes bacterium GWF2_42_66]|nr:MAG: ATP-dependent helicase [Bacteroidetes bacterium GWA2_42_15]OFY01184.1 MAG: ATP-dependent helicase [Bacteroidetes bacterium GWE2_42_39]OFY42027.1 MAG: ATP-dependent helicase [Bacteroidetes bacterium GWF2_42_66]HBL77772.1 ATP-dependent helicase [Prolixibacteraceae bacterium]HCB62901.1 ATP-dependent helicase [Bacteroidales bacterium]